MMSVVVPAHNEVEVISRCLRALTNDPVGDLEVVVVCNGCTDATADVARGFGTPVKVIETETPGKANALNLGDSVATGFPRFYVDADVVVTADSLRRMADRLKQGDVLAVSPRIRWDLSGASVFVRAFYDIDRRLPSHRETIGGSGVYGLSEPGRQRLGQFPPLTADDAYVRRCFATHERDSVEGTWSLVTPPKNIAGVVAIKTRSHFGNYELERMYPHLSVNIGPKNWPALMRLALWPWLWGKLAVYAYVKSAARIAARRRIRSGRPFAWVRDDSSRRTDPAARLARTTPVNS